MTKTASAVLCALLLAGFGGIAAARGVGAPGSGGAPHLGRPSPHSAAIADSNGRFAADRDLGLARAEDRMSAQGRAHQKATLKNRSKKNGTPRNTAQ